MEQCCSERPQEPRAGKERPGEQPAEDSGPRCLPRPTPRWSHWQAGTQVCRPLQGGQDCRGRADRATELQGSRPTLPGAATGGRGVARSQSPPQNGSIGDSGGLVRPKCDHTDLWKRSSDPLSKGVLVPHCQFSQLCSGRECGLGPGSRALSPALPPG